MLRGCFHAPPSHRREAPTVVDLLPPSSPATSSLLPPRQLPALDAPAGWISWPSVRAPLLHHTSSSTTPHSPPPVATFGVAPVGWISRWCSSSAPREQIRPPPALVLLRRPQGTLAQHASTGVDEDPLELHGQPPNTCCSSVLAFFAALFWQLCSSVLLYVQCSGS